MPRRISSRLTVTEQILVPKKLAKMQALFFQVPALKQQDVANNLRFPRSNCDFAFLLGCLAG
jgi:hypothetical protein